MRPCSECKGVSWVYDMQGARADCLTCFATGDADFNPWQTKTRFSEPQLIFGQLIEECGYVADFFSDNDNWHRIRASYNKRPNNPLSFVIGINRDGRVWISKTMRGDNCRFYNIHDPNSISELKEEMIKMREFHDRTIIE